MCVRRRNGRDAQERKKDREEGSGKRLNGGLVDDLPAERSEKKKGEKRRKDERRRKRRREREGQKLEETFLL